MSKTKKKGCCLFALIKWAAIGFAVLMVLALFAGDTLDREPSAKTTTAAQVTAQPAEATAAPTEKPTAAPTAAPTAEPATPEEWVGVHAQKIYGDSLLSIEWQDVDDDPMIVIQCVFEDNLTFNLRHAVFMGDAKDMFKAVAELGKEGKIRYSSCYIQGRTTFLDKYGNEFDGNAIEIRLKKDDLEKINWKNVNNDMLINLAAPYTVHPVFR